jgi:hypothetical protein
MVASPGKRKFVIVEISFGVGKGRGDIGKGTGRAGLLEGGYLLQCVAVAFLQTFQRQTEGFDRAFQALEQVGGHQRLQAFFSVGLLELASAAFHLGVVKRFVLFQATGQDVADRRIHGELELRQPVEDFIEADDVGTVRQRAVK